MISSQNLQYSKLYMTVQPPYPKIVEYFRKRLSSCDSLVFPRFFFKPPRSFVKATTLSPDLRSPTPNKPKTTLLKNILNTKNISTLK